MIHHSKSTNTDRNDTDDSALNCKYAEKRGWKTAHLVEPMLQMPATPAAKITIRRLEELRELFPQFFKSKQEKTKAETT